MKDFLFALFALLNSDCNYAVLRNHDGLPEHIESRDIDILIDEKELHCLLADIVKLLAHYNVSILILKRQQDALGLTLCNGDEIIQIDLLKNTDILGVSFIPTEELLSRRLFNGKVYHLDIVDSLAVKMLYSFSFGEKLPQRYIDRYNALDAADNERLLQILHRFGFTHCGSNCSHPLMKRFLHNLIHSPWDSIRRCSSAFFCRSLNSLCPPWLMISFTGPDGCGKTTVIELLRERLAVNPPKLFHFRPNLLPNLGEVGAKTGIKKDVDRNFDKPHRGKKHGVLSSLIRLYYYCLDYRWGYVFKILPLRQRKSIVFFDRYFTDVIVDHERSGIHLSHKFIAWVRHFVPGCQYNFFFRVAPDTILARKQELSCEAIDRIYSRMEYLASIDKRCYWIDNNGTPEEAVRQILTILAEHQNAKYAKNYPEDQLFMGNDKHKDIFWVNAVKALCMIGVYVAHAEVYYPAVKFSVMHCINPFYVTAFFFVNGYLFSMKRVADADECGISCRRDAFLGQLKNVFIKLVIPTIIFSTLIFVPRNLFHHEPMSIGKYVFMVLGGCANWFTAALACLQIYIAVLNLLFGNKRHWYLISAVFFFVTALLLQRIIISPFPWYWKSGMIGVLPFTLGIYYQEYESFFARYSETMLIIIGLYVVYCAFFDKVYCSVMGVQFDFPGVVVMGLGILTVIQISKWIPENRVLSYIGRHSIVFYFLSGVLPAFWGTVLKNIFHATPNYGIVVLSMLLSLASAAVCSWGIYRFLPFMVDIRKWPFRKAKVS